MCGILGAIGQVDDLRGKIFERALSTIAHRGPDAQGILSFKLALLGHRRLAIIDLSPMGSQPMTDPETGMVIVFNGEIYNYLELRKELERLGHRFQSMSDTETLLRGYIEWGAEVLNRCNGMWAFIIWDPSRRQAFAARDRFGVKPLYYAAKHRRFMFASEPKALHALDPQLVDPDPSALVDLIVNSRMHVGERTFYRSISALPPGHYAVYDVKSDALSINRFWDYPTSEAGGDALDRDEASEFSSLFEDAVRLRLRSDVPVGLTLSGGLDSSAVLAAAKEKGASPLRCYTSIYSKSLRGEQDWAEIAAGYAGVPVQPVKADLQDWLSRLDKVIHHMDGPGYSPAVLPLWSIMERARSENVLVLLEGQGADELLAGYPQYTAVVAVDHLRKGNISRFLNKAARLVEMTSASWSAAWLARQTFPSFAATLTRDQRLKLFAPDIVKEWRERSSDPTLSNSRSDYDPLRRALWQDHAINILPALLHYGDAISMAHGIETRLPFMDYRLIEWVFRRRPDLLQNGVSKSPVRSYLFARRFGSIAKRKDKLGYPVPMLDWYRAFGSQHLAEITADRSAPIWGFMRSDQVKRLAKAAQRGSQRGLFHLYKIVTADIWLRQLASRSSSHRYDNLQIMRATEDLA